MSGQVFGFGELQDYPTENAFVNIVVSWFDWRLGTGRGLFVYRLFDCNMTVDKVLSWMLRIVEVNLEEGGGLSAWLCAGPQSCGPPPSRRGEIQSDVWNGSSPRFDVCVCIKIMIGSSCDG
jgi:hypothetical protein